MPGKRTTPRTPRTPAVQPRDGFVAVGRVLAPRGVRGELKVDSLTDAPQRFQRGATVYAAGAPRTVRRARAHAAVLLLELEGIDTKEQAAALRGMLLEVPEAELATLDEGNYYRFQIVGLEVIDQDGGPLGHIEEILETGANDVYVVRSDAGELLIPAIDMVVKKIDVAGGRMAVELLPGLEARAFKPKPHSSS